MQDSRMRFYEALWGDSQLYRSIWFGKKGTPPNQCKWFTNTAEAIAFADTLNVSKQYNVYHSCALFDKQSRKQRDVYRLSAFWIDLDLKKTDCKTIKELALKYLPLLQYSNLGGNFWVVKTGNGLHVYWMLGVPLTDKELWLIVAKQLALFCKKQGIPHERDTDSASLLRVPGSWNVKDDEPKEVEIIIEGKFVSIPIETTQENNFKPNKGIKFNKDDFNLNQDLDTIRQIESDANLVADKCPLINQFRRDGLDDSEPLWHFALGVIHNCIDGDKYAQEFSAKSPRYNEQETTSKLAAIESNDIGPCLCETFESHGCIYCEKCSYKGKVKSPIQLGIVCKEIEDNLDDLGNDKQKKRAQELIKLAPDKKWEVKEEGIFKIVDDVKVIVSQTPFFIIDKFCEDVNDATIITALIRAHTKIGIITFKIPLKFIADERKLISEFNSRSIFPYNKKYFKEYITAYMQRISHIRPIRAVNSLGWQHDNTFVYGSGGEAFNKEGKPLTCIVDTKAVGYIKGFEAKGDLKVWSRVVEQHLCSNKFFYPHLFSLLCSLGAPLLPMTSVTGFILSLQGESGSGKTISHSYAMSVWGNPITAGCIGTKDTNTSMLARLGAVKNLPLRLDEATTLSATKLSGLVYELVNGRGRARAAIDGSLSNTAFEWQTLTLITTNKPLLEYDTAQITEAERYRILELAVEMPPDMSNIGKSIGGIMSQNYGVAGKFFIEWVIKNKGYVQQVLDIYFDKFKEHVDDSKRFWVNCGAIAFAAATIAEEIDLFKIPIKELYDWFVSIIKDQTTMNEAYILESRGFETKEELVDALRDHLGGHILTMNENGTTIEDPPREVKAMIKVLDSKEEKLYVRGPILNEFIKKHFSDSIKKVRTDLGIEDSKSLRVGSRAGRYYVFDIPTA